MKPSEARPAAGTRRRVLVVTLLLGLILFVWQLGSTGLVDETPPLFAAAARAMAETGDWLVPRVNGLPRYDKPPLVYWLMGLGYALPGQSWWNPLGTWAARLPSALGTVAVMLALADTLLRWPQPGTVRRGPSTARGSPAAAGITALTAALAFALSPLVLLWGRIAVSDALFTAMVAISLLLAWRTYADPAGRWWHAWLVLGLAVLTKGPVAVVLMGLTLLAFAVLQRDASGLLARLRVLPGLLLTALVAVPWYALTLAVEGRPFWDSFFGYHNLQRFTSVVNDHLQPWWFFLPVLVIASLPATPLLLLGLGRSLAPLRPRPGLEGGARPPSESLARFCSCWLLAVFVFFTVAATKLPSYWLPATPAAGVLIALAATPRPAGGDRLGRLAWGTTLVLTALLAAVLLAAPGWVGWIRDPEMPGLPAALLASSRLPLAAVCWLAAAVAGLWAARRRPPLRLLALQLPLVLFVPAALLPLAALGDRLRARPVREVAAAAVRRIRPGEPLAMVGILKPSLHYYSRHVVIYEGISPGSLLNLAERLRQESRDGQVPTSPEQVPSVLVVIDRATARLPHWQGLAPQELDRSGLYLLWRLDRRRLEERAARLREEGVLPDWQVPRPERY